MAEMFITSLDNDGVSTTEINDAPADIIQELWSALKRGDVTLITWGE